MDKLVNGIMRRVQAMMDTMGQNHHGIVTSVDPNRPAVKVLLQPDNVETGWLPYAQAAAGNGWGLYAVPVPGMVALCQPEYGVPGHYIVTGFTHNDRMQPPKVASTIGVNGVLSSAATIGQPGEFMLVHQSGSVMRMLPDGSIYMRGPVNIDGTLRVNGDVFDQHGSLDRLRRNYNAHSHPDPQGGTVGGTTALDPE